MDVLEHVIIDCDTEATTSTNINAIDTTPSAQAYLVANGFRKLPLVTTTANSRSKRAAALPRFFGTVVSLGIRAQQVYGVGDPLTGVAVWSTPQDAKSRLSDYLTAGFPRLIFSPLVFSFLRAQSLFARFEKMQKHYAPEPQDYLINIGVLPEAQGKGLASQLIRPFLAQADAQGLSVYTETMTPANVGLYEHYGLKVVERYDVPKTELSQWAFYRPVQTKANT